jgi:hypothetical protein
MEITYSQHAREQMSKRRIDEGEVEVVLASPYYVDVSRSSGNTIYFGRVSGRRLAVVVVPGRQPAHVVTVFEP